MINQFGLSCFKRLRPDGPAGERRYAAATFNFYLFPRPPEGVSGGFMQIPARTKPNKPN